MSMDRNYGVDISETLVLLEPRPINTYVQTAQLIHNLSVINTGLRRAILINFLINKGDARNDPSAENHSASGTEDRRDTARNNSHLPSEVHRG